MKQSNLFWGGILVTLGTLFILKNTDVIDFNWYYIFKLWPLLLILLGITLLPIKNFIKTTLTIFLLALTVILLLVNSNPYYRPFNIHWDHNYSRHGWNHKWDFHSNDNRKEISDQHFYEPYDEDIEEATLNINAAAGEFRILNKTIHLLDFTRDGNIGPYYYSTRKNNKHQDIKISTKKKRISTKNIINDVYIKLNARPVWSFNIDAGAAEVELDLREFKTKHIDLDGGASDIQIRLGEKYEKTKLTIDSGVSSIQIFVPENSGCEIDTDTFLSSKTFDGFTRIKRGLYQTDNFEDAKNKVYINIDAAITNLSVIRY